MSTKMTYAAPRVIWDIGNNGLKYSRKWTAGDATAYRKAGGWFDGTQTFADEAARKAAMGKEAT